MDAHARARRRSAYCVSAEPVSRIGSPRAARTRGIPLPWSFHWPYLLVFLPLGAEYVGVRLSYSTTWIVLARAAAALFCLVLVVMIQRQRRILEAAWLTDKLTGVYNSRYLRTQLDQQVFSARRSGLPLTIIFVDVDDLKAVNDRSGHMGGNLLLRRVANGLLARTRSGVDLVFRFGGDEFLILCPNTDLATARRVAARVLSLGRGGAADCGATLSIGVALLRAHDRPVDLLRRADRAMYRIKRGGKNDVGLEANSA